jgi:hypothetical protein
MKTLNVVYDIYIYVLHVCVCACMYPLVGVGATLQGLLTTQWPRTKFEKQLKNMSKAVDNDHLSDNTEMPRTIFFC